MSNFKVGVMRSPDVEVFLRLGAAAAVAESRKPVAREDLVRRRRRSATRRRACQRWRHHEVVANEAAGEEEDAGLGRRAEDRVAVRGLVVRADPPPEDLISARIDIRCAYLARNCSVEPIVTRVTTAGRASHRGLPDDLRTRTRAARARARAAEGAASVQFPSNSVSVAADSTRSVHTSICWTEAVRMRCSVSASTASPKRRCSRCSSISLLPCWMPS
jgi:hypothetical protein